MKSNYKPWKNYTPKEKQAHNKRQLIKYGNQGIEERGEAMKSFREHQERLPKTKEKESVH